MTTDRQDETGTRCEVTEMGVMTLRCALRDGHPGQHTVTLLWGEQTPPPAPGNCTAWVRQQRRYCRFAATEGDLCTTHRRLESDRG